LRAGDLSARWVRPSCRARLAALQRDEHARVEFGDEREARRRGTLESVMATGTAPEAARGCGRCGHSKSQHERSRGCQWCADRVYKFVDCDCPEWVAPKRAPATPRPPRKQSDWVVVPTEREPRVCSVCRQPRPSSEFLTRSTALRKSCQRCRTRRRLIREGLLDEKTGKPTQAGRNLLADAKRRGLI
jgi:hypothetical protein